MPFLALSAISMLLAHFFDMNKEAYDSFFVSPKVFLDRNRKLQPCHKLLFYLFYAALTVNTITIFIRLVTNNWGHLVPTL